MKSIYLELEKDLDIKTKSTELLKKIFFLRKKRQKIKNQNKDININKEKIFSYYKFSNY